MTYSVVRLVIAVYRESNLLAVNLFKILVLGWEMVEDSDQGLGKIQER